MIEDLPITTAGASAPQCATVVEAPQPRQTLLDMMEALSASDDGLASPDFDPHALIENIRDKVDNIAFIVDRMEATAIWLKAVAKPYTARASALLKNRQRLREYVTEILLAERAKLPGDFLDEISIPGNAKRVRLRDNPPALHIDRTATAEDFERYPDFVRLERSYVWNEDVVRSKLYLGEQLPEGIPARLTIGHWCEFIINTPKEIERKKKKKEPKK